jgi:hypothetical protein
MQKFLAISMGAVFSLCALGTEAQIASGNVAESAHPRADVLQAQNSPIHRTIQGCLTGQGDQYVLNARHIGVIHLNASSDVLSQHAGQRVKVRGDLAPIVVQDPDNDAAPEVANPVREMTVEQIESVSGSCPTR